MLPMDVISKGAKCEELERIVVDDDLEKFFQVRAQLPHREKEELIMFLKMDIDLFAWSAFEAPGVDPNFICHHLNVNPSVIPKKQPPQRSSKNHSDVVKDEVINLSRPGLLKSCFTLSG